MDDENPSPFKHIRLSLGYAGRGLWTLVTSQQNARIHLIALVVNIALGLWLDISRLDWGLAFCAMAMVWMAEAQNTAIEFLSDATNPEYHPLIKNAKDVAAASVLVAAIFAVVIGVLVYGPPVLSLLVA
jgi:diacylglycerol kinase